MLGCQPDKHTTIRSDYDLCEFFKIEQPIRQIQALRGAQYGSAISKGTGIFIMRVEQYNMGVRITLNDDI